MLATSKDMSKSELLSFRDAVTKIVDIYQDKLESVILNGNPSPREVADARLQITRLLNIHNTLTTLVAREILTDLDNAGVRIKNTTQKLQEALQRLESLNKIIGLVASLINVANAIINALTGGMAIAGIAGIINALDSALADSN